MSKFGRLCSLLVGWVKTESIYANKASVQNLMFPNGEVKLVLKLSAGQRSPGRITMSSGMRLLKVDPQDVQDRVNLRAVGRHTANLTISGKLP